jgi:hypothetical protein
MVNDQPQSFRRWLMNYNVPQYFLSPEANPFSSNQNDFQFLADNQPNTANQGIYLHWMLPDALRHGYENDEASVEFPLVPNRWLVVRYLTEANNPQTRTATAWLIESDAIGSPDGSPFTNADIPLTANSETYAPIYQQTLIGKKYSLATQTWQESNHAMYLQAVAPANTLFASYQPHVENIFSLHDDLTNQNILQATLSYLVIGWYSDTSEDPLSRFTADGKSFAEALDELQWFVENDNADTANTTLYQGSVLAINWSKTANLPPSAKDNLQPAVAIGNSSIDAFAAWLEVNQAALQQAFSGVDTQWLEALQHNLQEVYDQPDSVAVLRQRIHESWFRAAPGGTFWDLVSQNISIDEALPPPLSNTEKAWLDTLNQNQQDLDKAFFQLSALQQQLYEMWWKNGYANGYSSLFNKFPYTFTAADFSSQLDPNNSESLTSQVYNLINQIKQLQSHVPTPSAGQSSEDAITAFTQQAISQNQIQACRQLKALAKPRFHQATDPVLLISGVNHQMNIDAYAMLPCRFPDQIVTSINLNYHNTTSLTASQAQSYAPVCSGLGNVTTIINALLTDNTLVASGNLLQALLNEFFLLDPANAGIIASHLGLSSAQDIQNIADIICGLKTQYYDAIEAKETPSAVVGKLPAFYEPQWLTQPWLPLFIEWEVYWYGIPFQSNGETNWQFNGRNYELVNVPMPLPEPQVISGRSILTPKTGFDMKSRLEQYLANNPYAETVQELEAAIEEINGWDFLSQTLTGFSEQVALRDSLSNLSPDNSQILFTDNSENGAVHYTMADLIGEEHYAVPQSLLILAEDGGSPPVSNFEAMRNGQFFFRRITLVDQFGQALEIVTSQSSDAFTPILSEALLPDKTITSIEASRLVQLPPRLLQAARLNFAAVLPTDDNAEIFLNSDANPICGWVLPNHLDRGLSIYAPDGASLGELRPATDLTGTKVLSWQTTPNGAYATLAEVQTAYPHLGEFLQGLVGQSYEDFVKFMAVIDETLWTVEPLGERYDQNLSILIGRPLALVRAFLQFELQQQPLWDTSWPYTFAPPQPAFVNYEFAVKVGDEAQFKDGLLGYFTGNDYSVFNAVYDPNLTPSTYVQQLQANSFINLKFDGESKAFLTLLVDPRASVYAQTDLLPATALTIEQGYVQAALDAMEITFRVGPQLTTISTAVSEVGESIQTILMPEPAENNGVWSWQERSGDDWTQMPIAASGQEANLSSVAPTLREGLLKLTVNLSEENS